VTDPGAFQQRSTGRLGVSISLSRMQLNLRKRLSFLGALVMLSGVFLAVTATAASAQPAAALRPAATADPAALPDLTGDWVMENSTGPFLTVTDVNGALTVDMSPLGRPRATGTVTTSTTLSMTFPDDTTYTATLRELGSYVNEIAWSNGSFWLKVYTGPLQFSLNGVKWSPGGAVTSDSNGRLTIDMSALGRPNASGYVFFSDFIVVNFPDDQVYIGQLEPDGSIAWGPGGFIWTPGGSVWTQ
jgi:hypothetical protein